MIAFAAGVAAVDEGVAIGVAETVEVGIAPAGVAVAVGDPVAVGDAAAAGDVVATGAGGVGIVVATAIGVGFVAAGAAGWP